MLPRIYVDFNTMNQDLWSRERRVRIPESAAKLELRDGMRVIIYDETLEVEATLEYDREHNIWWARPDWPTRRDLSRP